MQLLREKALRGDSNHFRNIILCPIGDSFYPQQVLIHYAKNNRGKVLFKAGVLRLFHQFKSYRKIKFF